MIWMAYTRSEVGRSDPGVFLLPAGCHLSCCFLHPRLLEKVFPGAYATSFTTFDLRLLRLQYRIGVCPDSALGRAQVGFRNTRHFEHPGKNAERQYWSSHGSGNASVG